MLSLVCPIFSIYLEPRSVNMWRLAYTALAFVLPGVLTLKIALLTSLKIPIEDLRWTNETQSGLLDVSPYTYKELTPQLQDLSILVNALAAAGDVLIAAALCTLLHFSRTGFQRWEILGASVREVYEKLINTRSLDQIQLLTSSWVVHSPSLLFPARCSERCF